MKARDNLFAVERIEKIRYKPQGTTLGELLERLEVMNYCAAIVGPEGSGKTTLLEDIATALEEKGRQIKSIFINDTSPMTWKDSRNLFMEITGDQIVILDGADSLSRMTWPALKRGVLRKAAGLIVTAHKPGLMPTLIECTTNPELFRRIVAEITQGTCEFDLARLDQLYHSHNGNIRTALRDLYDLFAEDSDLLNNPISVNSVSTTEQTS